MRFPKYRIVSYCTGTGCFTNLTPPHLIWSEEEEEEDEGMIEWSGRMKRMIFLFKEQKILGIFFATRNYSSVDENADEDSI